MASSENPQTSPLTNEAPAEAPSVSLPPLPQTPALEATKSPWLSCWLDSALVVVVLLFAFLVASFPAINSDFFRHAAIGRLLLQGQYQFGTDPFVYTAGDGYFVNHSWLFDLLIFKLYQLPSGGAVVVIFKALLIAVLAAVLLGSGRRAGQSLWIPVVCTAIALLVASPRFSLYLQSTCLSFLFLGVTVFIVCKGEKLSWWLLPPLFALWVNCDSWFFLGPLTVALYLVGELIHQPPAPTRGAVGWLVLALGVAACLANPHHVHALTLPAEFGLTASGDSLEHDPQFHSLFLSPLGKGYYRPHYGLSAAGLAYWPLLLLGLVSFVLLFKRIPWPRLLVWTGFTLMSLYNWRAIPFFAIVAGPITALHWLDFAAQHLDPRLPLAKAPGSWALGGRALTLLLGLVLLVVSVPGWLQRSQPSFHHMGWSVLVDPSLRAMAEKIHGWREAGLQPEQTRWFNMYFEIANYLAWFAPGEQTFLDQSLPNFRKTAEDYLAVRQGLEQELERDLATSKTDWQKILREQHVRYWIFDSLNTQADVVARWILFTHPEEWVLCHLEGRIAVFGWLDPQQPAPDPSIRRLALDLRGSAFGPSAEPAPPRGVEPVLPPDWWHACWDAWLRPERPLSSDRESIALYNFRYEFVERPREIAKYWRIWQGAIAAGAIANSLSHGPVPDSLLALSWSCTYNDLFHPGSMRLRRQLLQSEGPAIRACDDYVRNQFVEAPSLYLAVRAARRALRVNPDDESSYFRLGQSYQHLRNLPQESQLYNLPAQLAPQWLDAIRRTQMVVAFQNCLRLLPDDDRAAQAHEELFRVYAPPPLGRLNYIDAAVHHLRQLLDKRTATGPMPGISPTQYNQMLDQMSAQLTRMEGELERRRNRYEVNAASKSGLEKVLAALQEGLSETALNVLEQDANVNVNSPTDLALVKVVIGVALDLGRLDKARELLPDLEGQPAKPEDLELYVRLAAARGDYAEADRLLDNALRNTWQLQSGQPRTANTADQIGSIIGRILLAEGQHLLGAPCVPWLPNNSADIIQRPWLAHNASEFWRRRWRLEAIVNGLLASKQQAEWYWTRGWLALEAGHCVEARQYFQLVRDVSVPSTHWAPEIDRLNAWLIPQEEMPGLQQLGFRHALLHEQSLRYLRWLSEF
jgi:tetratricopeptide (TPR) repeat protein